MFSVGVRGWGATLIGARVTGVRVTPTSGFWVAAGAAGRVHGWVSAEPVSSVGGGGGGAGLIGVGEALLGAGWAVVDACGATDVDCSGPVAGPSGGTSMTIDPATAADALAISTIVACFVRYHGAGGALNVSVL